jgi:hypothetical protein
VVVVVVVHHLLVAVYYYVSSLPQINLVAMVIILHFQHPITQQPTTQLIPSNHFPPSTMPPSTISDNFDGCSMSVLMVDACALIVAQSGFLSEKIT